MIKQLKVDVEKSLGYKSNGRLKAADKKEYAHLATKTYFCPVCNFAQAFDTKEFGEEIECPECGEKMQEKI